MPKPVLVVNPITGQQCYTKHPEKLIERSRARWEAEQLIICLKNELADPLYWNGDDRNPYAIHRPGEVRS